MARIMCQQSISTCYFHLLVLVFNISVNLATGLKLAECVLVAVQSDGSL